MGEATYLFTKSVLKNDSKFYIDILDESCQSKEYEITKENVIDKIKKHGKNPELIHYLEENKIHTLEKSYQYLIVESIKCHHNEITDYLLNNVSIKEHIYKEYLLKKHLKYYNFNLKDYKISNIIQFSVKSDLFYFFCKFDYFVVVKFLLTTPKLNVNQKYKIFKPHIGPDEIVLLNILNNHELVLKSEDQLIEFINELYLNDQTYSILYETVNFTNVSSENITTFVKIFDYNDMNSEIWTKISKRLQEKVELIKDKSDRYKEVGIKFIPMNSHYLDHYLHTLTVYQQGTLIS